MSTNSDLMIQHTPGPWTVGYSDGSGAGPDGFTIVGPDDKAVVRSGDSFGLLYGIEKEADARLIAAAPDLLAAAKTVLAELHARIDAAPSTAKPVFNGIADLHSAIAKAEGRS